MTLEEAIEILEKEKAYMIAHGGDRQAEALTSAIKALEQEPKTGRWEYIQYDNPFIGNWHCSECGRIAFLLNSQKSSETLLYNYCPWCGAKMESEDK